MTKQQKEDEQPNAKAASDNQPSAPLVITVDYEKYAHFLDDPDLTEAQKCELLQILWNIVCEFVSIGFNVHPVQQVKNSCGKTTGKQDESTLTDQNEVPLLGQFIKANLTDFTGPETERRGEGVEE